MARGVNLKGTPEQVLDSATNEHHIPPPTQFNKKQKEGYLYWIFKQCGS